MELWLATTNKGKLNELKVLFGKHLPQLNLKTLSDLPTYTAPPENGKSFLENARIKARSLKALKPESWVLAEDSGLEVEALNGLPGIHSARYAGEKASDSENVSKLLKMLQIKGALNRNAQFICHMLILSPSGEEWSFVGAMKGSIAKTPAGNLGFGYDPVFIPEGQSQSLAQLGPGYKNQHSHRSQAALQFIEKFKNQI